MVTVRSIRSDDKIQSCVHATGRGASNETGLWKEESRIIALHRYKTGTQPPNGVTINELQLLHVKRNLAITYLQNDPSSKIFQRQEKQPIAGVTVCSAVTLDGRRLGTGRS